MEIKKPRIPISLTEEELEHLEKLSALDYKIEDMAMYFLKNVDDFTFAAHDPESTIYYHIARGKLISVANEQIAILQSAEGGNISASQQLANLRKARGFKISKEEMFAGFDNSKTLRLFENWVEGGCKDELSKEEQLYLEALSMMNAMDRKYGRKNTITFFTKPPFNLKQQRASAMYDEAFNLFNTDRNVNKKAYRNKYADELDEAALIVRDNATTSKDWEVFGNLRTQAGRMRGLDEKEADPIPKELYIKPVRVFSIDPAVVGLPTINRQDVADQIAALEISDVDKSRVSADALLTNINFEEQLNELEETSKLRQ